MSEHIITVVPWHNQKQIDSFLANWGIGSWEYDWIILQQDTDKEGCAITKNKGVHRAIENGADIVVVLDDDCYPDDSGPRNLRDHQQQHAKALEPVPLSMFKRVTTPQSRGTPYNIPATMPVAASIGFWSGVPDWDAASQLVYGDKFVMNFHTEPIFGQWFALSGMNIAFRPKDWLPWCQFIDCPRWDDIWMGFLWQRHAYRLGQCFNLRGPRVRHSRQSNVWQNLRDEARYLEENETLWWKIATNPATDYESLRKLLPV